MICILRFAQHDNASVLFLFLSVLHDTNRAATQNLRPAESVAVCGGKLQSKGLGFGATCKRSLAFALSSRTETYGTRGSD